MNPDRSLRAPELLGTRLEVLKAGLKRAGGGDEEGIGTLRRMGKVFLNWAIGEGLEEVEEAAFDLVGAKDSRVPEAGERLRGLLEEILVDLGPSPERFVVLAVEENPDDAALLEVALKASNRRVHIVPTGAEAQRILEEEEVALLVLDLTLPDTDGRTLLVQTKEEERYRELTVLVVSGKAGAEVKAECHALGASTFFEKPVDPTAIAAVASSSLHKEAVRRLSARTDLLTHLLNRRSIRELWERWTFPAPSSVGLLGLDNFQALEDQVDHEVVDGVLASVGRFLRDEAPRGSVAARWDEAEFLILFPGLGRGAVMEAMGRLLDGVRRLDHKDPKGESFRITASGGVMEIAAGVAFDDAVEGAGALLQEAMEQGGNVLAEEVLTPKKVPTILLAEDDPLSAGILVHRLEREGFEILHYLDGDQALEGALSNSVSLAILDVKMPGMDGFELLQRLRRVPAYYELPIMMLTSMGREEDITRGFELGADDYMVKPFSPVEVLARIRRLLER